MLDAFFYPKPPSLPPVVTENMEVLLIRLQSVLEARAPAALTNLQPGLSITEITILESKSGLQLPDDLRALYRWRNGSPTNQAHGIIPGHWFPSLEWLIENRAAIRKQIQSATPMHNMAYRVFAGHRDSWIEIFPDGAGEGYFFDPKRTEKEGPFFYCFSEVGCYRWFPSIRNFMAGTIECYEKDAYRLASDGKELEENSELTEKVWKRYGMPSYQDP